MMKDPQGDIKWVISLIFWGGKSQTIIESSLTDLIDLTIQYPKQKNTLAYNSLFKRNTGKSEQILIKVDTLFK